MGFEYNIEFEVPEGYDLAALLRKLPSASDGSYQLEMTEAGFYFCDNNKSEISSIALRKVVDEALSYSDKIIVRES